MERLGPWPRGKSIQHVAAVAAAPRHCAPRDTTCFDTPLQKRSCITSTGSPQLSHPTLPCLLLPPGCATVYHHQHQHAHPGPLSSPQKSRPRDSAGWRPLDLSCPGPRGTAASINHYRAHSRPRKHGEHCCAPAPGIQSRTPGPCRRQAQRYMRPRPLALARPSSPQSCEVFARPVGPRSVNQGTTPVASLLTSETWKVHKKRLAQVASP